MTRVGADRWPLGPPAQTNRAGTVERLDGRARVLTALLRVGPLSRADLAREALLAASTVTGVVSALQRERLVVELEGSGGAKGPGRPSTLLALDRAVGVVVGLDFGKQHVTAAIADLGHQLLAERRTALAMDAPAVEQVGHTRELVEDMLEHVGLGMDHVVGMGAGLPGPVRRQTGRVGDSTILPGWVGVEAGEALQETFGLAVHVENDANLGALAEWMWGAGRAVVNMVYVKVSTGVGGGLILDGRPFSGQGGLAGEIGHIVISPGGPICRCGNHGCLEAITGSARVLEEVRASHPDVTTLDDVVRIAMAADVSAIAALARCGQNVGTALGGVCTVLNPGVVLIGGELAAAGDLLTAPLAKALRGAALGSAGQDTEVRLGSLGRRAEVLGAVALALRHVDTATVLSRA